MSSTDCNSKFMQFTQIINNLYLQILDMQHRKRNRRKKVLTLSDGYVRFQARHVNDN